MPDLGSLTDEQRAAFKEHDLALTMYRDAVEQRMDAQRKEETAMARLVDLSYRLAGVR